MVTGQIDTCIAFYRPGPALAAGSPGLGLYCHLTLKFSGWPLITFTAKLSQTDAEFPAFLSTMILSNIRRPRPKRQGCLLDLPLL